MNFPQVVHEREFIKFSRILHMSGSAKKCTRGRQPAFITDRAPVHAHIWGVSVKAVLWLIGSSAGGKYERSSTFAFERQRPLDGPKGECELRERGRRRQNRA